jgi:hypothetical protein
MHRPHLRRALALSGTVLAAFAGVTALAPAASANSAPAVSFDAPVVSGASATLGFTVNRAGHAIASAACTLTSDGGTPTPVPCGTPAAGPVRKSTVYTTTIGSLDAGDHVFGATITLTDGGTAAATESFTVAPTGPVEFADAATACAGLGGSFVAHASWWQLWTCDFDATADQGAATEAGFAPLCFADGGVGFGGGVVAPGRYEVSCWLT